jgi:membrane-bound metal-dependent hydrolase YbcI (DUF457 family)
VGRTLPDRGLIVLTGHFATALVPHARNRALPLFTLLMLSQLPDLLIPLDVMRSGERDLNRLHMTLSHDLVPVAVLSVVVALALQAWKRDAALTFAGTALVVVHWLCDLLSGFSHNVAGPHTAQLGLDLYRSAPAQAFLIEFVFAAGCLAWFFLERNRQHDAVGRWRSVVLCAVILLPIAAMLARAASGHSVF